MLTKPNEKQLRALRNLRLSQDFEDVREWLQQALAQTRRETDREANEVQLRWNQGAAQVMADLLHYAEHASEKLRQRGS